MSIFTECNYCTLRRYERKYGKDRVTTRLEELMPGRETWTRILVDGEPIGVLLQVVPDHCAC